MVDTADAGDDGLYNAENCDYDAIVLDIMLPRLELARYDAGQESSERHPVNLAERMGACVELIRPLARERGIQIHSD
jgi:signal transduction histidine kinase